MSFRRHLGAPKVAFGGQIQTLGTGLETKDRPKSRSEFDPGVLGMFWRPDEEPNETKWTPTSSERNFIWITILNDPLGV